ncbi:MAG: glycosyltransferase family 4 protein, partial [Pseudomonadota bacterium]
LRGIPDVPGGIETHCENLYERIAPSTSAPEVIVIGRTPYIGRKAYKTHAGIQVVPVMALRNKYFETISNAFFAIFWARFKAHADVVHIHAIGPGLLSWMARLLGMKVVLTHHGDDFNREKWNAFAKFALHLGERIGVTNAAKTIAVSPSLAERLKQSYPRKVDAIRYVPNGADHIVARAAAADASDVLSRFGLEPQSYYVGVGRLVPEKGFADLIRAHKAAQCKLPLVIVGGSSHSEHEQELSDLAHDGVTMTGSLPQAEVAQLLSQCRLFVMPSTHEGLPIAALEAWAMQAPMLLSDIQPNLDVGLPENHYFPTSDVEELTARLRGDETGLKVLPFPDAFNWTSIAEETAEIYNSLDDAISLDKASAA